MDSRSTPARAAGARKTISSTRDQKAAQRPGQAGARMIARRLIAPPCALMAGNAGHPVAEISHRPNFKAEANLASREHARLCWSCFGGEDMTQPPRGKPRCPASRGHGASLRGCGVCAALPGARPPPIFGGFAATRRGLTGLRFRFRQARNSPSVPDVAGGPLAPKQIGGPQSLSFCSAGGRRRSSVAGNWPITSLRTGPGRQQRR
jgi:hypothetical protein